MTTLSIRQNKKINVPLALKHIKVSFIHAVIDDQQDDDFYLGVVPWTGEGPAKGALTSRRCSSWFEYSTRGARRRGNIKSPFELQVHATPRPLEPQSGTRRERG